MLTIGSRGSQLAVWQARWVQARLEGLGAECRLAIIHTTGDKITDVLPSKVGTKGLFTKEIEEALLNGTIDVAVHSLKDMPTDLPAGLTLAAIPEREDPRDAMVGARISALEKKARVGTSSLRRAAQLRTIRPDLEIENIRGNLETRLRKLDAGQYNAIMLASAGLRRLGWENRISELLEADVMCPAVGQGALAVETRQDGGEAYHLAKRLEHGETRIAVTAERAVLASLGGGCQVPIGAHARVDDGRIVQIRAVVVSPDGSRVLRQEARGSASDAARIGRGLGERLLAEGGRQILESVYGEEADPTLRT
jgi:hydroxymethylbilane synthase